MQASLLTAILLPLALAVVMLGMGLSLVPDDFRRIAREPQAVALGAVCQLLLLPLIGTAIALLLPLEPAIAVGLVVIALCPGGPSSNFVTYLAGGDVALSVTLTALNSLITVFTIPILTNFALRYFLGETSAIALPLGETILQIFVITVIPIALGMASRQRFPQTACQLEKQMSRLAIALLALIILLLLIREGNQLPRFIAQVGIGVLLLNSLAMLAGLAVAKLGRLPRRQQTCLTIEVGIQNGTLAIAVTAGLLDNPDMAIPAAVYSLLMYLTALIAIGYGRRADRSPMT
ncbi:MAG: bile acid:sodium symporter family protein [Spirulinaceae cyanobacterium SM2_1_0]|nr:bile acid:sodium symporter family protein [Spirulinaceae cyanobacterium SM2_1_0]